MNTHESLAMLFAFFTVCGLLSYLHGSIDDNDFAGVTQVGCAISGVVLFFSIVFASVQP